MTVIEHPKTIISNPDSTFGYFAWPSVARLGDGTLAVVCSGFRIRHVCPFGKAVVSYSRDDGKSWTYPAAVIDTPLDDRDSGICADGKRVIVTSFNNSPQMQRKWLEACVSRGDKSPKLKLIESYLECLPDGVCEKYLGSTYKISRDGGYTFGELKRSPVTSPHGPMKMDDGRIIWVGKRFDKISDVDGICAAVMNENEEFEIISDIAPCADEFGIASSHEAHAVQTPTGRIIAAIRAERGGDHPLFTVYISYSDDGGKTFSTPKKLLPDLAGSPPHLTRLKSGEIVLSYACRHGNRGIRAKISRDGGETFGEEIKLTENAPSSDIGYPATVERLDGSLLTVWYEKEDTFAVIKQMIWKDNS